MFRTLFYIFKKVKIRIVLVRCFNTIKNKEDERKKWRDDHGITYRFTMIHILEETFKQKTTSKRHVSFTVTDGKNNINPN